MHKNISLLILSMSLVVQPVAAQDPTSLSNVNLPKAVTVGIGDGIVRYVRNQRQVKINLEWEPLPVTNSLIRSTTNNDLLSIDTISISNQDLERGNWSARDKMLLEKALDVNNLTEFKSKNSDDMALKLGAINVPNYVQSNIERNVVKALLQSKGILYSFGFKKRARDIVAPNFSDKGITWKIQIYTLQNTILDPGQKSDGAFYRFTVKAVVDPLDHKVPSDLVSRNDSGNEIVFYDARFKLKRGNSFIGLAERLRYLTGSEPVIPMNSNTDVVLPTSESFKDSLSSLSGFLSIIGGSGQLGAVTESLLSGTENTSIITGGLVANNQVSPLVGVNQELINIGDDSSAGVLLGLGLGSKQSIYVGPSFQASVFTISTGVAIGTQDNANVNFAGMIAIDLSRLSNGKRNQSSSLVTNSSDQVPEDLSVPGIEIGLSPDILKSFTLVDYKSQRDVELERICDQDNKNLPKPIKITLKNTQGEKRRVYISQGVYKYVKNGTSFYWYLLGKDNENVLSELQDFDKLLDPNSKPEPPKCLQATQP